MNPAMAAQYRQQYQQRGPQPGQVRRPQGEFLFPPHIIIEQLVSLSIIQLHHPRIPESHPVLLFPIPPHPYSQMSHYSNSLPAIPQSISDNYSTSAGPPQMTPEQMRAQRQREQLVQDQQRRAEEGRDKIKAKTPTDKTMPEGVDKLIVGDGVQQYKRLREVERKLDSVMMRKYLDMKDSIEGKAGFTSYQPSRKKLKIWISNTVENQPWQGNGMEESAFDFNMGVEATYKVKIQGQVIEDEEDDGNSEDETETPDQAADGTKSASIDAPAGGEKEGGDKKKGPSTAPGQLPTRSLEKTKLSHFFKGITIEFDRDKNLQPEGITQVEWKKQHATAGGLHPAADFDSLEFERKSDENMNCTVNFYWDEPPDRERYLLDKPLSELLDTEVDDRASIIMGIWEYIKALGLQHDENKRQIYCDERMKAVCFMLNPIQSSANIFRSSSAMSSISPKFGACFNNIYIPSLPCPSHTLFGLILNITLCPPQSATQYMSLPSPPPLHQPLG